MKKTSLLALAAAFSLPAADPGCPNYPAAERTELSNQLELERLGAAWGMRAARQPVRLAIARNNFIDQHIFGKMEADAVNPAPLTGDAEFLRRVSIDLTGRIPSPERAADFLASAEPGKRALLIEELLASSGYNDQFTLYFGNRFEVTSSYYSYIGLTGRNLFHRFLRDFVERDRPYNQVVTEMLTASGDADRIGPANFLSRGFQQGDPIQDTWDTLTDRVTVKLLGFKTECVSCHAGRAHLEQINLWLTARRREEFWQMSAFFSRMNMLTVPVDAFSQRLKFFFSDRTTGGYYTTVSATSPGPRPPRTGGPYAPAFITGRQTPRSENYRQEFARILTGDRQFAKATVNYLWAYFFNYGLVDPPDAWDLARVDPKNPPPAPWTLQVTHPELLDQLADQFIRDNYSVKSLIRTIVNSNAYQLSSKYEGAWRPQFVRYFAKHIPRRLASEEMFDAVQTSTGTEARMFVSGFTEPLTYANQLPDPTEPRSDGNIRTFLNNFGRGDWWNVKRDPSPTILQLLYSLNGSQTVLRTMAMNTSSPTTRAGRLAQSSASDDEVTRELFLATLTRYPTAEELQIARDNRRGTRLDWISDLQWALLNKLDFIFNY